MGEDEVRETGIYVSPWAPLRELADVVARSHSIIFECLWQLGQVPEAWRKANTTPVFKKEVQENRGSQPHLGP